MPNVSGIATAVRRIGTVTFLTLGVLALCGRPASASVVSIPTSLTVAPGGTVTVPVNLAVAPGFTVAGYTIEITFDPNVFTFAGNVTNGGLLSSNFTPIGNSNPAAGELIFNAFDSSGVGQVLANGASGTLFTFDLQAKANAPLGPSALTVVNDGAKGVYDTLGGNQMTGTAPGSIYVAAIPEPSQVAFMGLLVGLAGVRAAWSRRGRGAEQPV